MSAPYDLFVLGGGTAGLVGAKTAARLGARVLLAERGRTGGDCLWTGCVPSKSLLAAAHAAAAARSAARLGVQVEGVRVDFAAVMTHVRTAIATIEPNDSPASLRAAGVEVRRGQAILTGPGTATVAGDTVRFRQALLATGAGPVLPGLPGLVEADPLTSESVWELRSLPADLVVLGGGSIGCEMAQAFARLGSRVSVVEAADRLLSREDRRASTLVEAALRADGVDVRTGVSVMAATADGLRLADGTVVHGERILVAVGRRARTEGIGLERAGVEVDERGFVVVDATLRTTASRIWAAGDLTSHPQFTHLAGVHASTAASNAVLGLRRKVGLRAVPRVTFTDPEVAAVGGPGVREIRWEHADLDRAVAEGRQDGFTSLNLDSRGRVVGATVVGPRAGETMGELTLAVAQGMRARSVAATTHAYPTYNDAVWNATVAELRESLSTGPLARVGAALVAARRGWLDLTQRRAR